ncbi:MAG: hypothetical protein HY744_19380 [Deltaproteobacteria bacterium]|nr:hypothetical protein [Deltaproteobacteria bacterium]
MLRALPGAELRALVDRLGIDLDARKRIDVPGQVARALVRLADLRDPASLPAASVELVRRIAEQRGRLRTASLPAGIDALCRRGIVFVIPQEEGMELVLPIALLLQLKSWEGEDPRSIRALLSEAPPEAASAVASHYLRRPSTPPLPLSLEAAWEVLGEPALLAAELERVSHQERRLLEAIERVGGEVDTQELMDLEREPLRVRGVYGLAAGRRGAAFSLEKRGFLFPQHPNRYVIPAQVAAIIGAECRVERERRRDRVRGLVVEEDHLPRRARFSDDPAPLALALALAVAGGGEAVRADLGTPRSLVRKLAQRFGRGAEATSLLAALSRAAGLWEPGGASSGVPPWSLRCCELAQLLFDTWRRGGAWDEARPEPDVLRVSRDQRDPSPAGVLREVVLDALLDLGEGRWVPYQALTAYIADDPRLGGIGRLLGRWARRAGVDPPAALAVAERMLTQSLPALGVVDMGEVPDAEPAGTDRAPGALRLTTRGRDFIASRHRREPGRSEFRESRRLRVGSSAVVADVLALGAFADIVAARGELELELGTAALTRGLAAGIDADEMGARIGRLAVPSAELAAALREAATVVGRATLVAASGFLWVDDDEIRQLLRTRLAPGEPFLDPSPPAGLLLAPGADAEKLVRRCRALGVEIDLIPAVARRRPSGPPPAQADEPPRRSISWWPPALRQGGRSR